MITASVVSPRVFSNDSGDKVLLADQIDLIMSSRDHAVIRISGVGKSTAIKFLQDLYGQRPDLIFDDDGTRLEISEIRAFEITTREIVKADVVLPLAGWDKDDVIEYLLARNPTACKSVLSRIEDSSFQFCDGSPEVWSYILDQMLAGETGKTLGEMGFDLLRSNIENACDNKKRETPNAAKSLNGSAVRAVLFDLLMNRPLKDVLSTTSEFIAGGKAIRLLQHQEIRDQLIGKEMAKRLHNLDESALSLQLPPKALSICARRIENSAPVMTLVRKTCAKSYSVGGAASLLLACDPNWKPANLSKCSFAKAHLDGARWNGSRLLECNLNMASFRNSQFREANLRQSNLNGADFADSDLTGAVLYKVNANHGSFSNCILTGVITNEAVWRHALLRNANLDEATLTSGDFDHAILIDASFVRSDLRRATFCMAILERTDFSFANCMGADFSQCDLRSTIFFETNCVHARFDESNLEDTDLLSIDLGNAYCRKALFSGSRMRGANLQKAQLNGARMAEIDWEACNLSGADLRNCDFHYGSTRCGLVDSPYPSHGTRTGFYTDDYDDRHFRKPEEIRKANLRGCDLRDAKIEGTDFYLVDLRDAKLDKSQRKKLAASGAILD